MSSTLVWVAGIRFIFMVILARGKLFQEFIPLNRKILQIVGQFGSGFPTNLVEYFRLWEVFMRIFLLKEKMHQNCRKIRRNFPTIIKKTYDSRK